MPPPFPCPCPPIVDPFLFPGCVRERFRNPFSHCVSWLPLLQSHWFVYTFAFDVSCQSCSSSEVPISHFASVLLECRRPEEGIGIGRPTSFRCRLHSINPYCIQWSQAPDQSYSFRWSSILHLPLDISDLFR